MLCPRCGDEWDATRSSCSNCGFAVRTANPTGSAVNNPAPTQRGNVSSGRAPGSQQLSGGMPMLKQQSGNLPGMRQPSGDMPTLNAQPARLTSQPLPNTPRPMYANPLSPIPPRSSHVNANLPLALNDSTTRPAFEKNVLRKVSPTRDAQPRQAFPQAPPSGTDALPLAGRTQHTPPLQPGYRTTDYLRQDMPLPPAQARANGINAAGMAANQASRIQPLSGRAYGQQQGLPAPARVTPQPSSLRPLLPGALLRGNRYRLQELQERQDWLSGVFEATWVGKDAHRGGGQVTICEVMLPEGGSVMTQTTLRTATMTVARVGRQPRI